MGKLDTRVAIVTGASIGIGQNIAMEFAKEGAAVVVVSRTQSAVKKVAEEIGSLGGRSLAIVADVSVAQQVRNMVEQTKDHFGRIDILVNNAGIVRRAPLLEFAEEDWDAVLDVDLKAVFLCSQAVAKHMIEQRYGKIINMSSITGRGGGTPALAAYCAAKAGVIALTKCFAKELGPHGINVNAIAPGAIDTDQPKRGRTPKEILQWQDAGIKSTVMGRLGNTQDIAHLALFLASDDSSFIAGQTIPIDGGKINRM